MAYDLNDPNLDFDIEQEAIINALKGARADQRQKVIDPVSAGGFIALSPMAGVGAALGRLGGDLAEQRTMREQRDLAGEQQRRFDTLQQELTTPMTKEVEGYSYGQGPLMDLSEQPRETVPQSPLEQSKRRLDIYSRMSRLPMARGLAQAGIKSEVDFPERQALLEQQQAAQREQQAQRDHEKWRFAQQFKLTADQQKEIADKRTEAMKNAGRDTQVLYTPDNRAVLFNKANGSVTPIPEVGKPPSPNDIKKWNEEDAAYKGLDKSDLLLKEAEALLPTATGSGVGWARDQGLALVGKSTEASKAAARLKVIAPALVAQVPRFEGPQSDKDVQLYQKAAGDLGNALLPVEDRMAALATIRDLNEKYRKQYKENLATRNDPRTRGTSGAGNSNSGGDGGSPDFEAYYNSIPDGATYIDPNGNRRVKGRRQ